MTAATGPRLSATGTVETTLISPSRNNRKATAAPYALGHPGLVCVGSPSAGEGSGVAAVTTVTETMLGCRSVDHSVLCAAVEASAETTDRSGLMVVAVLADDEGEELTLAHCGTGGAVATVDEDGVWCWVAQPTSVGAPSAATSTFTGLAGGSRVVVLAGAAAHDPSIGGGLVEADLLTAEALATALQRRTGAESGAFLAVIDPWGRPPGTPAPRIEGTALRRRTRRPRGWRRGGSNDSMRGVQAGSTEQNGEGANR